MILKDKVLLSNNILSSSCKEAKNLKMLGVEYIPYDACSNDYILYRGEYVGKEICLYLGVTGTIIKKVVNHMLVLIIY